MEITFKGSVEELAKLMPKPLFMDAPILEKTKLDIENKDIDAELKEEHRFKMAEAARHIKVHCMMLSKGKGCDVCMFSGPAPDDTVPLYIPCKLLRSSPCEWPTFYGTEEEK